MANSRSFVKGTAFSKILVENLVIKDLPMSLFLWVDSSEAEVRNVKVSNVTLTSRYYSFLFEIRSNSLARFVDIDLIKMGA